MADWNADPHEFVDGTDNGAGPVTIVSSARLGNDNVRNNRVDIVFSDGDAPPTGGTITVTCSSDVGSFFDGSQSPLGASPLTLNYDDVVNMGVSWFPAIGSSAAGPITFSFDNDQGKGNPPSFDITDVEAPPSPPTGSPRPRMPQLRSTGLPVNFPGVL